MQEFVEEEILAIAGVGLGRQRSDRIKRQLIAAVIRFARPDCQHHITRHTEFLFDTGERVVILRRELPAACRQAVEACLAQILRRRLDEFRLLRLFLGPAGNSEVGQRKIGLQSARGGVESRAGNTKLLSRRPLRGEPLLEGGIGGVYGRRKSQ